ncbi:MAG: hypothetical protein GY791_14270 [Alphaproteobacteria bacterium]|nr:hypothetical protein [Alphaproteobacteria bacterium]
MHRYLTAVTTVVAAVLALAATAGDGRGQTTAGQAVVYKDWKLTCTEVPAPAQTDTDPAGAAADNRTVCYIFNDVRNPEDDTVLAAVGLRYMGAENKPFLIFQLLPSIDREFGVRFAVDDGPVREGDVRGCDDLKCLVVGQVSAELLTAMKAGNVLILSFKLGDQQGRLDLSLLGFTDASSELTKMVR